MNYPPLKKATFLKTVLQLRSSFTIGVATPIRVLMVTCFFVSSHLQAQKAFLGFEPLSDTLVENKQGLFVLPLLYYTPDTRWAAGGAGVFYFRIPPKTKEQKETRISFVQFLADYTQNQQFDAWGQWNIFTRDEDYLLQGELRFRNFPDRFYGLGNNSLSSNEEKYAYNLVRLNSLMMKEIKQHLYAGLDYEIEYEYGLKYTTGGELEKGHITGYKGGFGSALGLVAALDSRDNIINPYTGTFAEVATYLFGQYVGGQFNFFKIDGVYQRYWQLRKHHILATQTKLRITTGEVPFLDMSTAGDEDILRGYPANRYRDNNFMATQVEYRFPLFWRFGGVSFAGIGDVFNSVDDLRFDRIKYSVGGGLRFVIKPAERLNVRLDYGYGRHGGEFYFAVKESF